MLEYRIKAVNKDGSITKQLEPLVRGVRGEKNTYTYPNGQEWLDKFSTNPIEIIIRTYDSVEELNRGN
jgi:hypothetical protein